MFDPNWSTPYYQYLNGNTTAQFNQISNDIKFADYHQYPCARLATPFNGPFRVELELSGYGWVGIGTADTSPTGFAPYENAGWMVSMRAMFMKSRGSSPVTWMSFFDQSQSNLTNSLITFENMTYFSNQRLYVTCHPQDRWMMIRGNNCQARYDLTDLPQGPWYFMVSMNAGHAHIVSVTSQIQIPAPVPITWVCNQHQQDKHHFFISYRVASEAALAGRLFNQISMHKPGITTFMDAFCLPHATDWRQTFERGLNKSKVIILLISEAAWASFHTKALNGPDNVLLEAELALIRLAQEPEGSVAIFPVFVGSNHDVDIDGRRRRGVYVKCSAGAATDYPASPHARGFPLLNAPATIQDTIQQIMMLNGMFLNPQGSLTELLIMLFKVLARVSAVRRELLLDPCTL